MHYIMIYFMLIWFLARLVLVDIPQRMLNIFYCIARGLMHKEIFISCKCTHWLKHCCLEAKFIILAEVGMYSLLYRHILWKHVAFISADYCECNQVTIGLWLTWCELVNVAIHTCEHIYTNVSCLGGVFAKIKIHLWCKSIV